MTQLYDTLSALGYKQRPNSTLPTSTAEFHHPAQIDDQEHLANLHNSLATHGYSHIDGGVMPTWVNHNNDDDAISLHHRIDADGHRLFHMNDDANAQSNTNVQEGFEVIAQDPKKTGQQPFRVPAKTNNDARELLDKLRTQYPTHHITVRNKHTGMTQLYRPHKEPVTENTAMEGKTLTQIFEAVASNEKWGTLSRQAKELVLHADNNRDLTTQSKQPIAATLKNKMAKGNYDHTKASKLWSYHADRAAHSFTKQNGISTPWDKHFSSGVRREAAKYWADAHRDSFKDQGQDQDNS